MNNNPYKSAVEHLKFNQAFDEQTIALMIAAAQRKKTNRPFRIPIGSWRYIAAAAGIAILFIAIPLLKGPQNTNETTVAAAMTAAGYETTVFTEETSCETIVHEPTMQMALTIVDANKYVDGIIDDYKFPEPG